MLSPELGQFSDNARAAAGVLIFGSIGDGKYLVGVEPVYVQSDSGPFVLDLCAILNRALGGSHAGGVAGLVRWSTLNVLIK
jgi:hypothetical protein